MGMHEAMYRAVFDDIDAGLDTDGQNVIGYQYPRTYRDTRKDTTMLNKDHYTETARAVLSIPGWEFDGTDTSDHCYRHENGTYAIVQGSGEITTYPHGDPYRT